jgi:hypothetical protein
MPSGVYQRESLKNRFDRQWILDIETGCWLWTGLIDGKGYGYFHKIREGKRKKIFAHRLSYELFYSFYLESKVVHHSCYTKDCVNPMHLVLLDPGQHTSLHLKNGDYLLKAQCPQGHLYTEDNVYRNKEGHRSCRSCSIERSTSYIERNKEKVKIYRKAYYQMNRDIKLEYAKNYRETHKQEINSKRKLNNWGRNKEEIV